MNSARIDTAMGSAQHIHFNLDGVTKAKFLGWFDDPNRILSGNFANYELWNMLKRYSDKATFYNKGVPTTRPSWLD
jgi:hypothetical protein